MTRSQLSPWAVLGLYLFAFVLVVSPLIDFFTTVWPPRPSDLSWRYGFLGLAAGYLHTPLLGLVLGMSVAFWQDHVGALRFLGIVSAVAAVALMPVLVMWPLDVLMMRDVRAEDAQMGVLLGGVIQEVKYLGVCLILACLGFGGVLTVKQSMESSRIEVRDSPGIISRTSG